MKAVAYCCCHAHSWQKLVFVLKKIVTVVTMNYVDYLLQYTFVLPFEEKLETHICLTANVEVNGEECLAISFSLASWLN